MLHINLDWGTYPLLDILICEIKKKIYVGRFVNSFILHILHTTIELSTYFSAPAHATPKSIWGKISLYIHFILLYTTKWEKKFGIKNLQLQFTYTKPALDDKFDRGHLIYQVVLKGSVLIFKRVPDLALDISERSGI